jgi:hypothetical protein
MRNRIDSNPVGGGTVHLLMTISPLHGTEDKHITNGQGVWLIDRPKAAVVEAERPTLKGLGHRLQGQGRRDGRASAPHLLPHAPEEDDGPVK